MTIDELRSAAAVVRDATEDGENTATRIGELFLNMISTLSALTSNRIKGYVVVSTTGELPPVPDAQQRQTGYLLGTTLYVYVGEGGNTLGGKYEGVDLQGPQGNPGVSLGEVELVDDLTTGGSGKALSARQGVVLKGLVDAVDGLLDPFRGETWTVLAADGRLVGGTYVHVPDLLIGGGHSNVRVAYYAVNAGERLTIKIAAGASAAVNATFNGYGIGWFNSESAPAQGTFASALVMHDGEAVRLSVCAGQTLLVTVPEGVRWLAATEWIPVSDCVAVSRVDSVLCVPTTADLETLGERVGQLEPTVANVEAVVETAPSSPIAPDMGASAAKYIGPYGHLSLGGDGRTWVAGWEVEAGQKLRVKFAAAPGDDLLNFTAVAFFATAPDTQGMQGLQAAKPGGGYISFADIASQDTSFDITVPEGYSWLAVSSRAGRQATVHSLALSAIDLTARGSSSDAIAAAESALEAASPTPAWYLPPVLYAVVGQEKRLYLDNIANTFGGLTLDYPSTTLPTSNVFGGSSGLLVTGRMLSFTPSASGSATLEIAAYGNNDGREAGRKSVTVSAIAPTLPQRQLRVCMIGDSITENRNMAYFVEQKLAQMFPSSQYLPVFVGTKRHEYAGYSTYAAKTTRNEGHFGHSYTWLIGNASSPLVHNGSLDIAHWRTASGEFTSGGGGSYANRVSEGCGLGENDHIHVVSLAMGFNGTDTAAGAQTEFAALQTLIAAFRADYADTVFIVQLVTLTAAGDGVRPRTAKNASLLEFRRLCIEAYGNGQDSRVLLGDLGCCYDRWFAYRRALVPAAPQYSDQIEVIDQTASGGYAASDTTHPSDDGTKQMGESIVPVLLHAMQLADE